MSADLQVYFEDSPNEIVAALEGVVRHLPPAGDDEALAVGYLFVLQGLLEHLRYRIDRGYADAAALIADFQAAVAAQAQAGRIDRHVLPLVAGALQQARIPASPELVAVSEKLATDQARETAPAEADIDAAIAGMVAAAGGDPFLLVEELAELGHAMSGQVRGELAASLACAGPPEGRSAAVLFLLDPDATVRHAAAQALEQVAATLSPSDVRRLIAMRNWRPEKERAEIDSVIRVARAAGVECAQWPAGGTEAILASTIDGAASQGFLLLSPTGRKKRLSSILTKGGIADAWSGKPETRRQIESKLAVGMDAPMLAVSRQYLDRWAAHHLWLGLERGQTPPAGLLQVAETIGGADWQPAATIFDDALAALIAGIPGTMRGSGTVATILRRSGELADLAHIEEAWFEDDPEIARIVADAGGASRRRLATYLLQTVIARRRDKWADLFCRTASWLREASAERDLCWPDLAIVAKAVAEGAELTDIGLMRNIASRTIEVLRDTSSTR
ncbi:MAG: hypothetical protein GEV13_21590 [Rhodospirillales bacterium]|nr:hypothetical protein [Rhodospirillales bacterium]